MTAGGVLVLSGPPCSGKSSVGRILSSGAYSSHDRIHIEVDALFSLLLPRSDRSRGDRMLAYDAAHVLARMLLERHKTVVLECTYARREQRASLLDALTGVPAPLWVVEILVAPDDAVARHRQRQQETDLDERLVREHAQAFPYYAPALRLTASEGGPDDLARQIADWLRDEPRPVDREKWAAAGREWT